MKLLYNTITAAALFAVSLSSQGSVFFDSLVDNALNFYEDQNRESVFDINGNNKVDAGDVFVGYVRIDDRSSPLPGESVSNDVYGVFSLQVASITPTAIGGSTLYNIVYAPTTVAGLKLSDLGVTNTDANSLAGVYGDVGANYITASPGDVDGDGRLSILDFTSAITANTLDMVVGLEESVDHWFASGTVNNLADPIGNLALLESLTISGGIPGGTIGFHGAMGITYAAMGDEDCPPDPIPAGTWCWGRLVDDNVEFPATQHELTVQNGSISGASDLTFGAVPGNPYFSGAAAGGKGTLLGYNFYGLSSNADFGLYPIHVPEPSLIALMGLGLLGLGVARRRGKAA
jgi:hypothetical protein